MALSTAESEYISAASCCAQLLYMRQTLRDYGVNFDKVPLLCDNKSAIQIAHNPAQHKNMKHIEIRHHFIRDHVAQLMSQHYSYYAQNEQNILYSSIVTNELQCE